MYACVCGYIECCNKIRKLHQSRVISAQFKIKLVRKMMSNLLESTMDPEQQQQQLLLFTDGEESFHKFTESDLDFLLGEESNYSSNYVNGAPNKFYIFFADKDAPYSDADFGMSIIQIGRWEVGEKWPEEPTHDLQPNSIDNRWTTKP